MEVYRLEKGGHASILYSFHAILPYRRKRGEQRDGGLSLPPNNRDRVPTIRVKGQYNIMLKNMVYSSTCLVRNHTTLLGIN